MRSLFDKELTEMEREVRDLKTIHQRGLGTTRFYSATATKNVPSSMGYAGFSINAEAGAWTPIAVVPAFNLPEPVAVSSVVFSISSAGDSASVMAIAYTPGNVKLKVMCSSPIESIS